MRLLILALFVLFAVTLAYPSNDYQPRYRKSQTQEVQPFIRFRKSVPTQPIQWMYRPELAPYFE